MSLRSAHDRMNARTAGSRGRTSATMLGGAAWPARGDLAKSARRAARGLIAGEQPFPYELGCKGTFEDWIRLWLSTAVTMRRRQQDDPEERRAERVIGPAATKRSGRRASVVAEPQGRGVLRRDPWILSRSEENYGDGRNRRAALPGKGKSRSAVAVPGATRRRCGIRTGLTKIAVGMPGLVVDEAWRKWGSPCIDLR